MRRTRTRTRTITMNGWLPVRPEEWPLVMAAGGFAFCAVALAIVLRTWSDAAFLSAFDVAWLPTFFLASAVVFVPATFAYAWVVRQLGSVGLNTLLLLGFSAFTLACFGAVADRPALFAAVLGLAVVSPLANVICWNSILDRLDGRRGRRLIPVIGGISTLGAITAGMAGGELVEYAGADSLLWVAFGLQVVMVPLPRVVSGSWQVIVSSKDEAGVRDGIEALGRNRLLAIVAAGTFLMALTTNLVDYQFKAHVQAAMDRDAMGVFLARFHGFTNLAVLFVQFLVVPRVLRRFGVGLSFALHPVVVLLGAAVTLVHPVLATVVALRFADTLLKFTFHTDTNQLVLTPVPVVDRHQAKVFLKGIVYPLGGFCAGIILSGATWLGLDASRGTSFLVVALALVWVTLARSVTARYLHEVGRRLKIDVKPGRTLTPTPPEQLVAALRQHMHEVQRLRRRTHGPGDHAAARAAMGDALDRLFVTLGRLVGDRPSVAAAADRYLYGSAPDRADAVELLDTLLHTHRMPDAADLLDSMAADGSALRRNASRKAG